MAKGVKTCRRMALLAVLLSAPLAAQEQPPAADETAAIPVSADNESPPDSEAVADTQLDVITVTATKRARSQREIPGSVNAIKGEDLEKISAQSLEDYIKLVPGVSMSRFAADRNIITIRGINSSIGFGFTATTVGTYVDDIPFQDLFLPITIPDLNPFDLERVEILKGPQGTLFGSGALAGAVRYILAKPALGVWQGKLSATHSMSDFGGDDQVFGGMINVPIGNSIALRGVALVRDDQGNIDEVNRPEKDINNVDQATGRLLASWQASDRLKLSALYFAQETEQADIGYSDSKTDFRRGKTPHRSPADSAFDGGNLLGSYDFDWGTLVSTSNVLNKKSDSTFIADSGVGQDSFGIPELEPAEDDPNGDNTVGAEDQPLAVVATSSTAAVDGYTQEFRILSPEGGDDSPWEWLAGVAYLSYHQIQSSVIPLPVVSAALAPFFPPVSTPAGPVGSQTINYLNTLNDSVATEQAVFAEVTRTLGQHWEVTLGGRYYRTLLVADTSIRGAQAPALGNPAQTVGTETRQHAEIEEQGLNPKLALRFLLNNNIQTYALAAKGFQFGGVQLNPPAVALSAAASARGGFAFAPYKSSTLWNYELGVKTEWLDRRLQFDVTGFYLDWKDLQLTQPAQIDARPAVPEPLTLFSLIGNVGAARSSGVEAALNINPARGLNLSTSAAWISAVTSEEFDNGSGTPVPAGSRLPGTPRFAMANTLSYATPLAFLGNLETGLALTHTHTGTYFNTLSGSPSEAGGYDLFDARVSLVKPDWSFAPELNLSLNNVFDIRGAVLAGDANSARDPVYFLVPPRTAVLSLQVRY